jgi:hypothetical protein
MQRVSLEGKIERVTADLAGRLQPGGERELPRLAGKGTGQQAMLDLCRQRQRNRALTPLEQIGVAAVRNHHVRQEVCGQSHIGHRLLNREVLQSQLQHTDRLAAAGHGREHASAAILGNHLDRLGSEPPPVRRPNQGHPLRGLLPVQTPFSAGMAQANQRPPAEIGDKKADLAGADRFGQCPGEHIDRRDRRSRLDRREQQVQVQRRSPSLTHPA